MIINQEIEWKIKLLKHGSFKFANKPGKLLAWQLKKQKQNERIINKIKIREKSNR